MENLNLAPLIVVLVVIGFVLLSLPAKHGGKKSKKQATPERGDKITVEINGAKRTAVLLDDEPKKKREYRARAWR